MNDVASLRRRPVPPGVIRWGELPVPFVASWSSESEIFISVDPTINAYGVFRRGLRGEGRPLFGQMDESRVRRVVTERLCQVCALPFGKFGYVVEAPTGTYRGRFPVINEPLSCEGCFTQALALCPGITRILEKPRGFAARVRNYERIASTLTKADGPHANEELNRALDAWVGPPPIGYLRLALTDYDILSSDVVKRMTRAGASAFSTSNDVEKQEEVDASRVVGGQGVE
jgi:hypothetical protein